MRRWMLSKKDRKKLSRRLSELYPKLNLSNVDHIEVTVDDDIEIYIFDGVPAFIKLGEELFVPHLKYLLRYGYKEWLPYIVVDKGAVKPISRGADLMRPGIVEIPADFDKGSIVVIVEPTRRLPLAIHHTLYNSSEIKTMEKGRVTKKLHNLGDRFWKFSEIL
ncbi:DUF1947 domain-containing protein [Pyrodictium delaneyi]|uniref:Pseudouridine synthase n=1 Tax=Pyrodictium delaneyi TaxID=1273541 RepID=A0A211YLX5_9CREN|nr:DUF1947 domain-containing protein [Pyrodictium delaneyi]OWJ53966.1 pseudouridine synthase [Pyrodictium delaneyi]